MITLDLYQWKVVPQIIIRLVGVMNGILESEYACHELTPRIPNVP